MMRKGNATILASVFLIALVTMGVGAGSMAWFSTENKTTDTFTMNAATMSMAITTDSYIFDDMEPGEEYGPIEIEIANTGTMDIRYLAGDLVLGSVGSTALEFADKIEVIAFNEWIPGYSETNGWIINLDLAGQNYQGCVKDGVDPFTLLELAQSYFGVEPGTGAYVDQFGGYVSHPTDWITGYGYDTVPEGTPAIAEGGTYKMRLRFKFSEDAGNDLQGKTLSFTISFLGVQDMSQVP